MQMNVRISSTFKELILGVGAEKQSDHVIITRLCSDKGKNTVLDCFLKPYD